MPSTSWLPPSSSRPRAAARGRSSSRRGCWSPATPCSGDVCSERRPPEAEHLLAVDQRRVGAQGTLADPLLDAVAVDDVATNGSAHASVQAHLHSSSTI